jgi:hypothetical protein
MLKLNTALAAVAIAIAVTLGFAHSAKAGATIYKSMPCSVSYAGNDYTGSGLYLVTPTGNQLVQCTVSGPRPAQPVMTNIPGVGLLQINSAGNGTLVNH